MEISDLTMKLTDLGQEITKGVRKSTRTVRMAEERLTSLTNMASLGVELASVASRSPLVSIRNIGSMLQHVYVFAIDTAGSPRIKKAAGFVLLSAGNMFRTTKSVMSFVTSVKCSQKGFKDLDLSASETKVEFEEQRKTIRDLQERL
ncbi:hypothetical protein ACFE04_003023 [Oxalis oulophora]